MAGKPFFPPRRLSRAARRFCLVSWVAFCVLMSGPAYAQERTPSAGRTPVIGKTKESAFAEAARVVAERLIAALPRVEGLVIGVEGDQFLIDCGTAEGVFQGMELEVFREGEDFAHPLTGEVLGRLDRVVGLLRVLQVRERYAVAAVIRKDEKVEIRQRDQVRLPLARMIVAFPNIDVEAANAATARSVTKELAAALVRTGRFELIEDRQLRSLLAAEKNMTAGELADPRLLKQLSEKGRVQALLLGRLTSLEHGMSLDVQVYSTITGSPLILASADVKPGGVARDRPSTGPQVSGAGRMTEPSTDRSTERMTAHVGEARASRARTALAGTPAPSPSDGFRLGPVFDQRMQGMVVGDVDGDGNKELVLVASDRLIIYRIDGRRLTPLGERPLSGKETIAVLEAADITGEGRAAVILTFSQKGRFHSQVLHWKGGHLETLLEAPDRVLRPLSLDGRTSQLFGQEIPGAGRLPELIRRYAWDGKTFTPDQPLEVPAGLSLLGLNLADLGGEGGAKFLTLKEGAVLEVRSQAGELVATYRDSGRLLAPRRGASPRILVEGGKAGEQPQIILGREEETGTRMLRWLTRGKAGSLTALRWDGAKLKEAWQTPPSEGSLIDYAVADFGGGFGRHLLLLVVKEGKLGFGGQSEIQAFRLR